MTITLNEQESLEEPLLEQESKKTGLVPRDLSNVALLRQLLGFSFSLGMLSAILSQVVLYKILWKTIVSSDTVMSLIVWSSIWTLFTCGFLYLIVHFIFFPMIGYSLSRIVGRTVAMKGSDLFLLEAVYTAGTSLTLAASWFAFVLCDSTLFGKRVVFFAIFSGLVMLVTAFFGMFTKQSLKYRLEEGESMPTSSSFLLFAMSFGLVIGLSSQLLLIFLFPTIGDSILLSVTWSVFTTIIAFMGYCVLESTAKGFACRTSFRVEMCYTIACIIGIVSAWILIASSLNLHGTILPSCIILALSLIAVHVITFFPEDRPSDSSMDKEEQLVNDMNVV